MPYSNEKSAIYIITCIYNDKHYIGSSVKYRTRLSKHRKDLRNGKHHSFHLQRAWDKYGEKNFKFDLLEEYDESLLPFMEYYWIMAIGSYKREYGYNIDIPLPNGGRNIHDKYTRLKISNARKGIKLSDETKKKLSEINKGKVLSKRELYKLQEGGRLYRKTQKYKNDMRKRKEKRSIKTIIYNLSNKSWKRFNSLDDASIYLCGYSTGRVYESLNNQRRSVKNHLMFSEDKFDKNIVYTKQKRIYNENRGKKNKS